MGPRRFVIAGIVLLFGLGSMAEAQPLRKLFNGAKTTANANDGEMTCVDGQCQLVQKTAAVATAVATAPARYAQQAYTNYRAVSGANATGYGSGGGFNYGSGGSLVVGQRLSDGSFVTSVGVTVAQTQPRGVCDCCCPDCKCNQPANGLEATQQRIGDRYSFRRELIEAAIEGNANGQVTDLQVFGIRALTLIPGKAELIQAAVNEHASANGISPQSIDWKALLIKLIPILLDLFK